MASYNRNSRFVKHIFLLILSFAAVFVVFQLLTSNANPSIPSLAHQNANNPQIAIVTFTTEEKSYTQLSLKNKHFYARRHGYDLLVDWETHDPMGTMWHKFVMLEQVMAEGKHDWIWWIDFDTLVTNTTVKLEDIIEGSLANSTKPDKIDFLFTPDCFQLNAGSMLVRSTPSALAFLTRARAYGKKNTDMSEQDCIRDLVNNNRDGEKDQTLWIPQRTMNAFPEEIKCWEDDIPWRHGEFVIHFAGAWAHMKEDDPTGVLMKKYQKEIIWE